MSKAQGTDAGHSSVMPATIGQSPSGRAIMRWRQNQLNRLAAAKEKAEAEQAEAEERGCYGILAVTSPSGEDKDPSSRAPIRYSKGLLRAAQRAQEIMRGHAICEKIASGPLPDPDDPEDYAGRKVVTMRVILQEAAKRGRILPFADVAVAVHRAYNVDVPPDVKSAVVLGETLYAKLA